MGNNTLNRNEIVIAKRLMRVQFRDEPLSETLLEEFRKSYVSYETTIREVTWKSGRWVKVTSLFDYFFYCDETQRLGPFSEKHEAERYIHVELSRDIKTPTKHSKRYPQRSFESNEVQAQLRSSRNITKLLQEEFGSEHIYDEFGNFDFGAEGQILNYLSDNANQLDSYGPLEDGCTYTGLYECEGLYWVNLGDGFGQAGYFLTELEARFYAEACVIPPPTSSTW